MRSQLPRADFLVENHFPELTRLAKAVRAADWSTVEAVFAGLTDPDDHLFAAWMVARIPGSEELLKLHATAENGPLGLTLYAMRLVVQGWDIRTAERAANVSADQFRAFHDHVARAEALLIEATALDPDNVSAWAERVLTARALEFDESEARRRYHQVDRQAPHTFGAQRQLLQKLCPKWGGSFEAAEAFVHERVAAAPPGSAVPALIVDLHIERWPAGDMQEVRRYMSHPAVRTAIMSAAERSVHSPQFRPGLLKYTAHNSFAAAFCLMGEYAAAAQQFEAIGPCATESPWDYFGDDAKSAFEENRTTARARG